MVATNTLRFTPNDAHSNRQEIERLAAGFQERHAGRTVAITHEIRNGIALLGISLVPLTDDRSKDASNYMLGVVEIPVGTDVTVDQVLAQLDPIMEELKDRER